MRKTKIGQYLREARVSSDMTQGAVAKAWGKSQATVSDVERGVVTVDREDVPALATALGRPLAEVMDAAGYKMESPAPSREKIKVSEGVIVELVWREGEHGTPLLVTPEVRAILEQLSRIQQTGGN